MTITVRVERVWVRFPPHGYLTSEKVGYRRRKRKDVGGHGMGRSLETANLSKGGRGGGLKCDKKSSCADRVWKEETTVVCR